MCLAHPSSRPFDVACGVAQDKLPLCGRPGSSLTGSDILAHAKNAKVWSTQSFSSPPMREGLGMGVQTCKVDRIFHIRRHKGTKIACNWLETRPICSADDSGWAVKLMHCHRNPAKQGSIRAAPIIGAALRFQVLQFLGDGLVLAIYLDGIGAAFLSETFGCRPRRRISAKLQDCHVIPLQFHFLGST